MTISNNRKKEAEQIFNRWRASLIDKPRNHTHLTENFDELFFMLHRLQLPYELAYDYLERAYGAHLPNAATITWQYKNSKWAKSTGSEKDFADQWRAYIKDKATNAFHVYFEIPNTDNIKPDEIKREKAKAKRSSAIREYMENFKPVDLKALRQKIKDQDRMIKRELEDDTDLLELL
jgi:hypothetical protein